jgi:hypothetical protein
MLIDRCSGKDNEDTKEFFRRREQERLPTTTLNMFQAEYESKRGKGRCPRQQLCMNTISENVSDV